MGPSSESSSLLATPTGEVSGDLDRRSVTQWEEVESNREDGELPVAMHVAGPTSQYNKEKTSTPPPDGPETARIDFARSLSLLSKSAPSSKKDSLVNLVRRNVDDEMIVDSESEADELTGDVEPEVVNVKVEKPWQDHALRDFKLILRKRCGKDEIVKLEAKVSSIYMDFMFELILIFTVIKFRME
jgi:THO complex subunit 5